MDNNPDTNNQSASPVQPMAQPAEQVPNDFVSPVQPTQFVARPEMAGTPPKKSNKTMILLICLAVAVVVILVVVFLLLVFNGKDDSAEEESNNDETTVVENNVWSCYGLGAFGQIYFSEGSELTKVSEVKIDKINGRYEMKGYASSTKVGKWDFKSDSKTADSGLAVNVKVEDGKVSFYGTSDTTVIFDKYQAYMYPDGHDDDETTDGEPYNIELRIWFEPGKNSEAFVTVYNSNASGYFNAAPSYYCSNDSNLTATEINEEVTTANNTQQTINSVEDTMIRDMAQQIAAEVTMYQTNNLGNFPSGDEWEGFVNSYLSAVDYNETYAAIYCDYTNDEYACTNPSELSFNNNKNEFYVAVNATCNDDGNNIQGTSSKRRFAVYTVLSNDKVYCASN